MSVHFLVVDDEPDLELLLRQKFRKKIRSDEWRFTFAGNGREALTVIDSDPSIDLVLTDINMPGMDGLTLLSHIAERGRSLKTVVVSAYGDMANIRTAMNRGAFDFVTKPIDFEDLSTTIEKTWREVQAFKQASQSHDQLIAIQKELDVARRIQEAVLLRTFPDREDIEVYAAMDTAREVGGDFYDFYPLGEHQVGLAVGDVSGKGVSAAMFMAVSRALLEGIALHEHEPATCLTTLNRMLYPQSLSHMFVTVFFGILDTRTGILSYCNGGHNPPYLLRASGLVEPLPLTRCPAVCLTPRFTYRGTQVTLEPGDRLLLYTDGVTEARSVAGEEWTEARLEETLRQAGPLSATELVNHVLLAVRSFSEGAPQADDITLLAASRPPATP